MLHSNNKDTLPKCIRAFKKLIAKDWHSMTNANPEVFIRSYTTRHVYICTSTSPRVESTLWSLMRNLPVAGILLGLPEKRQKQEELELIIGIFDSACEAHLHLAMVTANLSSLAKVTDQETLKLIMKSAVQPFIQMNVPEGFLDPIKDKESRHWSKSLPRRLKKQSYPDTKPRVSNMRQRMGQ